MRRVTRKAADVHAHDHPHDDLLAEELGAVHIELARVDTKSSMLLGLAGAGLVLATAMQPIGIGGWFIKAGMGLAAMSLVPLLAVARPRLGKTGFVQHARRTAAELHEELGGCDGRTWRSEQLAALARIAVRKFKLLRIAVAMQTTALVLSLAGAVFLLL